MGGEAERAERVRMLTRQISERRRLGRDVSLFLAARAEVLFHTLGGLGACLADAEEILDSPYSKPKARIKALPLRACIFAFLGCDELCLRDLDALRALQAQYPELQIEIDDARNAIRTFSGESLVSDDCPASFVCNAADWHRARRFAMIRRNPEIKKMYETKQDLYITCALVLILIAIHLVTAYISSGRSISEGIILAASIGATCAYGFQALTHELGHMAYHCGGGGGKNKIAFISASMGSSFCNFPWHYYYWNYHNRHHANTGGERDRDGDILFKAWHSPPILSKSSYSLDMAASAPHKWLWTGFFAMFIYPLFRHAKATLDSPHYPSIYYEGWNLLTYSLVTLLLGPKAVLYVFMSAAFSLGAFGHPFIQFWLTQHAFVFARQSHPCVCELADKYAIPLLQPTCSGWTTSWLWKAFNFGELRHVEHHDFPNISYLKSYRIPKMFPEFYNSLESALGPMESLSDWLMHSGIQRQMHWMRNKGDFAGRTYHLDMLWRLMSEMEDTEEDELVEEDSVWLAASSGAATEQDRPWTPSGDVDDEMAFIQRPLTT